MTYIGFVILEVSAYVDVIGDGTDLCTDIGRCELHGVAKSYPSPEISLLNRK